MTHGETIIWNMNRSTIKKSNSAKELHRRSDTYSGFEGGAL